MKGGWGSSVPRHKITAGTLAGAVGIRFSQEDQRGVRGFRASGAETNHCPRPGRAGQGTRIWVEVCTIHERILVLAAPEEFAPVPADVDPSWTVDRRTELMPDGHDTYQAAVMFLTSESDVAKAGSALRFRPRDAIRSCTRKTQIGRS